MEAKDDNGLPGREACLVLMSRFNVPPHVVRHCQVVCGVAMFLTRRLAEQGLSLDPALIRAGAMLHDITKAFSFKRPLDHSLTGSKVLKRMGLPEVASIVRQHVRVSASRPDGRISAAEIVNYSDKRVIEDQIAPLTDRLDYIRKRYGRTPEALALIEKFAGKAFELERDIFEPLPLTPEKLSSIDALKEYEIQ